MMVGMNPLTRAMSRDYSDWAAGTTGEVWKGLMRRIRRGGWGSRRFYDAAKPNQWGLPFYWRSGSSHAVALLRRICLSGHILIGLIGSI
jgi:hypothetical protein